MTDDDGLPMNDDPISDDNRSLDNCDDLSETDDRDDWWWSNINDDDQLVMMMRYKMRNWWWSIW